MIKIYFDENLDERTAEGFDLLTYSSHKGAVKCISTKIVFGRGAKDEDIIPQVAKEGAILITQDTMIRRNPQLYSLCQKCGIRIVFINQKSGNYWNRIKTLVNHWDRLIEYFQTNSGSFGLELLPKGAKFHWGERWRK